MVPSLAQEIMVVSKRVNKIPEISPVCQLTSPMTSKVNVLIRTSFEKLLLGFLKILRKYPPLFENLTILFCLIQGKDFFNLELE